MKQTNDRRFFAAFTTTTNNYGRKREQQTWQREVLNEQDAERFPFESNFLPNREINLTGKSRLDSDFALSSWLSVLVRSNDAWQSLLQIFDQAHIWRELLEYLNETQSNRMIKREPVVSEKSSRVDWSFISSQMLKLDIMLLNSIRSLARLKFCGSETVTKRNLYCTIVRRHYSPPPPPPRFMAWHGNGGDSLSSAFDKMQPRCDEWLVLVLVRKKIIIVLINKRIFHSLAGSLAHHFELNDKKMDGWKDGLFHQCHQTLQL